MADQAEDLRRLARARLAWRQMTSANQTTTPEPTASSRNKTRRAGCSGFFDNKAQAGWAGRPIQTRDRVP